MLSRGPWAEAVELFPFGKLAITLCHDSTDSARLIFFLEKFCLLEKFSNIYN